MSLSCDDEGTLQGPPMKGRTLESQGSVDSHRVFSCHGRPSLETHFRQNLRPQSLWNHGRTQSLDQDRSQGHYCCHLGKWGLGGAFSLTWG